MRDPGPSDRTLFIITIVVAVCSISYELMFSHILRTIFGGTKVQYGITIGVFLASLGVGSVIQPYIAGEDKTVLFWVETLVALTGPLGLLFIIYVNSIPTVTFPLKYELVQISSRIPVVLVGLLSGVELPLLNSLIKSDSKRLQSFISNYIVPRLFFLQNSRENNTTAFSDILGADYLGTLIGSFLWVFVLFPQLGLVKSVFALGCLNAAVAYLVIHQSNWIQFPSITSGFSEFDWRQALATATIIMILLSYGTALAYGNQVDEHVTDTYISSQVESEWGNTVDVNVTNNWNTKYQQVTRYTRTSPDGRTVECVRLDMNPQLCESWVKSYHDGLIDIPNQLSETSLEDSEVLVVGGGDWIAVNRLRKYNSSVTHVDIDSEYYNYTKNKPYYEKYHNNSYEYDKLTTHSADAFTYLTRTDKEFDYIFLDIPGARSDKSMKLYSVEFYDLLSSHLSRNGVVVAWGYSPYTFSQHSKVYRNTVAESGFESSISYYVWEDTDGDGREDRGELFYMFSNKKPSNIDTDIEQNKLSKYTNNTDYYYTREWTSIKVYEGVKPNRLFHPNYNIVVKY